MIVITDQDKVPILARANIEGGQFLIEEVPGGKFLVSHSIDGTDWEVILEHPTHRPDGTPNTIGIWIQPIQGTLNYPVLIERRV